MSFEQLFGELQDLLTIELAKELDSKVVRGTKDYFSVETLRKFNKDMISTRENQPLSWSNAMSEKDAAIAIQSLYDLDIEMAEKFSYKNFIGDDLSKHPILVVTSPKQTEQLKASKEFQSMKEQQNGKDELSPSAEKQWRGAVREQRYHRPNP